MSASDEEKQQRNREIAQNEAVRQNASALRVSGWAIAFAVIAGVVAVWLWLNR
jgi:hypothetical protein